MQQRAALWITGTFRTSPTEGIEAIAGLIPIILHLCKLIGWHHLQYASIPPSYTINSLLDSQYAKEQPPHKTSTSKLTSKQCNNLKSLIKDTNECLNGVRNCFTPVHPIFSPGLRSVNHFPGRINFHSSLSSSNEDLYNYLQNLEWIFQLSQTLPHNIAIITNGGVKKLHATTAVTVSI